MITSSEGRHASSLAIFSRLAAPVVLVAAILISAAFILADSGIVPAAPMDQHFAETVNLQIRYSQGQWAFQYPALQNSGGITSSLIAGIYKLIIPTDHNNLNWHIRIVAMGSYLLSVFLLARSYIPSRTLRILAFLIVASSGFQLLQPSSDLFAAALLNGFLAGVQDRWPRVISALFLAGFGLTKVDMILAALALALLWFWWDRHKGRKDSVAGPILVLAWLLLLLLPAFVVTGANPLSGGRSTVAFLSAYGEFFGQHQFLIGSTPPLDEAMQKAQANSFGGAESFPAMVLRNPTLYADFVGVSAARSLPNLVHTFKLMLLPIGMIYWKQRQISASRFLLWAALIAAICVIVPAWLVIFVRIRYAAKCVAPLVVLALAGSLELNRTDPRMLRLAWLCGIGTIAWQLFFFNDMAISSHFR